MKTNNNLQTSVPPHVSFARLSCPPQNDTRWSEHPRVFLAPDKDGMAKCPYCGKKHQLLNDGHRH